MRAWGCGRRGRPLRGSIARVRRRLTGCGVRVGDQFGCGEGAEVGGASGVVGGMDAEIEIDGEEEV